MGIRMIIVICEGEEELGQAPLPNIIFLHAHNFPAALSIQCEIENQKIGNLMVWQSGLHKRPQNRCCHQMLPS